MSQFNALLLRHSSERAVQAAASEAWPARPVLELPASEHARRLPSPGHQLPAGQPAVVHWHVDVVALKSSAEQQVSSIELAPGGPTFPSGQAVQASIPAAREQPDALYRPAGQSAQVLHLMFKLVWLPGHLDGFPTWYCPAPQPLPPYAA